MIIYRVRVSVKRGYRMEFIEAVKAAGGGRKRICATFAGDNDIVQFDVEFKDMADYSALVENVMMTPEGQAAQSSYNHMINGITNELLWVFD